MIADIAKGNDVVGVIGYHEDKVQAGKAELLYNGLLADSRKEYIQAFKDVFDLNKGSTEDIIFHPSISLPEGEDLTNEKFVSVALEYMEKMGYKNSPMMIYRHNEEGKKNHVHIVSSKIGFDGKLVSQFNDHFKSMKICRELETKHSLTPTVAVDAKTKRLAELNMERFSIGNALEKHGEAHDTLKPYLKMAKGLDNTALKKLIGEKPYSELSKYMEKNQLIEKPQKKILFEKLDYLLSHSKNKEDFLAKLDKQGLYYRELIMSDSKHMVYGDKSNSLYIKESKLPERFSVQSLNKMDRGETTLQKGDHTKEQQKKYLQRIIPRIVTKSSSLDQMVSNLSMRGIETKVHKNEGGIYGFSFVNNNALQPIEFKASEVDRMFSAKNILAHIQTNEGKSSRVETSFEKNVSTGKESKPNLAKGTPSPNLKPLGNTFGNQANEDPSIKKERKKKEDEDKNEGMSL
jgi:hypothetical protein